MNNTKLIAAALLGAPVLASAAPMDAFLESSPHFRYESGYLEAAGDVMNDTLDVFNVRGTSGIAGENTGDYKGGHLRGGVGLNDSFWIDGAYYKRKLTYGVDQPRIDSWQVGAQWRFLEWQPNFPEMSLRLSAWGNQADSVSKSTPSNLLGVTFDSLSVSDASDQQIQTDLIATFRSPVTTASVFGGVGVGKVKVDSISAQQGSDVYSYRGGQFYLNGSQLGIDPDALGSLTRTLDATSYDTRFAHAGFNVRYQLDEWSFQGGYDFYVTRRDKVDDLIEADGRTTYTTNHTLVGDIMYRIAPNAQLFARGQVMKNQFLGEIPFLYNSVTSSRFNQKYGLVSFGVVIDW